MIPNDFFQTIRRRSRPTAKRIDTHWQTQELGKTSPNLWDIIATLIAVALLAIPMGIYAFWKIIFNTIYNRQDTTWKWFGGYTVLFFLFYISLSSTSSLLGFILGYFFCLGVISWLFISSQRRKLEKLEHGFLVTGITDARGETPQIRSIGDDQIILKCPGFALEDFDRCKESLGTAWQLRIKDILPSATTHDEFVIKFSKKLLLPRYDFDEHCINYFIHEAQRESWLIGHDGDELLVEQLGTEFLYHQEVAGATRMGKSNYLKSALATLCLSSRVGNELSVECYFVDYKMGMEFFAFRRYTPAFIATDEIQAASLVDYIFDLMLRRMRLLADNHVVNIQGYRELHGSPLALKRIVVVIDEAADFISSLDLLSRAEKQRQGRNAPPQPTYLEKQISICRRAAACGISMVYATQYPMADIIPSALQINLSNRVCFKVPSIAASCNVLNYGDAATLPTIAGRMIYSGRGLLQQLQALYIKDIDKILGRYIPPVTISQDFINFLEQSNRPERRQLAQTLHHEQSQRIGHQRNRVVVIR